MRVEITTAQLLFVCAITAGLCLADVSSESGVVLDVAQLLALSKRIEQIESRVVHQDRLIHQLQEESEAKDVIIKDLQDRLATVENSQMGDREPSEADSVEDTALREELQTMDTGVNASISSSYPRTIKYIQGIVDKKLSRRRRLDPAGGQVAAIVAFNAAVREGDVKHIYPGEHIMFNDVRLNLGNAYHETHGVFIAPQRGLYLFSVSLLSSYDPQPFIEVDLVKNVERLALIYGYGGSGHADQGSATIVVVLDVGDEVWVRENRVDDGALQGYLGTLFSGVLLTATE